MHVIHIRNIVIGTILALMSGGLAYLAWAAPVSLLTNPGAETGDFTGWTQDVTGEPWTISSSDAHGGLKSFLSGNGANTLIQTVDLLGLGYTEAQLDSIAGVSVSAWVKEHDDAGEDDTYDMGLQMLGSGFGAMAITSLIDPHIAPTEWTQRETGLGNYGPGMRHLRVILTSTDGAGTPGNHGAMFDDIVLTITGESTAPTLMSVSPADGATGVAIRPELTLNFSEDVTVGSGNITVHRANTNEAIATIDVTSDAVQGSGTETITVTLPENPSMGTEYYVTIDDEAFQDIWENTYAGISSTTAWNFRTAADSSVPAPQRTADYTISDVRAEVQESGETQITWHIGSEVPFVRVFAAVDGGPWENVSDFLLSTEEWTWQMPTEYHGKAIEFFVESTDLAVRLGGAAAEPVVWQDNVEQSPEEQNATTLANGSYLRTASSNTVYYIDADGRRRPILDATTFFTWETSFDVVQIVTEETIAMAPLGPPLPPKPGTVLIKVQSVPKVFATEGTAEFPVLRWITSESLAAEMYGEHWNAYVVDVPPTLWPHLTFGSDVEARSGIAVDLTTMLRREALTER